MCIQGKGHMGIQGRVTGTWTLRLVRQGMRWLDLSNTVCTYTGAGCSHCDGVATGSDHNHARGVDRGRPHSAHPGKRIRVMRRMRGRRSVKCGRLVFRVQGVQGQYSDIGWERLQGGYVCVGWGDPIGGNVMGEMR